MARKKMGRSLPSAELATQHPRDRTEHVAGLSPNPATNLLAACLLYTSPSPRD